MKILFIIIPISLFFHSCSSDKTTTNKMEIKEVVSKKPITYIYNHDDKPDVPTKSFRAIFNNQTDFGGANIGIGGFKKMCEFDVVHSTDAEWAYLILANFEQKGSIQMETYETKYWKIIKSFSTDFNSCVDTSNNYYGREKFVLTRNQALGNLVSSDSIVLGVSIYSDFNEEYSTDFSLIHKDHFPGWGGTSTKVCKGKDGQALEILGTGHGVGETRMYYQKSLFLVYWDCESAMSLEDYIENELKKNIGNHRINCENFQDDQIVETKVIMDKEPIKSTLTITLNE